MQTDPSPTHEPLERHLHPPVPLASHPPADHHPPVHAAPSLPIGLRLRKLLAQVAVSLYLPAIFRGMAKTFEWMFREKATLQYPEENHTPRPGYRGEHRLKKDEQGRRKCVACFMCQTSCPAECIHIVAEDATDWPDRDKRPVVFQIDLLKCIYCGMCEEACPCDAIELTTTFTQVATSRSQKVYDMELLLMAPSERPAAIKAREQAARSTGGGRS